MLRDLFERPAPVIHLDAAIARDVRAGDVVFIGLPSDWHPEMIRQVQDFADKIMSPRLPKGVSVILVPMSHAPVILRGSVEKGVDAQGEASHAE